MGLVGRTQRGRAHCANALKHAHRWAWHSAINRACLLLLDECKVGAGTLKVTVAISPVTVEPTWGCCARAGMDGMEGVGRGRQGRVC